MKIRKADKEDLREIANIFARVYADFDVGEKWTNESAYKLMSYWFDRQSDLFFVAEIDNKLIGGFVSGIKPWWDGNHLVDGELFVDPKYQKKGIGRELSKVMYTNAIKKYNIVSVEGITFRNKKFPLSWHKSIGFREIDEWVLIGGKPKSLLNNLK